MNYKELKKVIDDKKLNIYDVANEMNVTYEGLKLSIERETIQLKNIKLLCKIVGINPIVFFENINIDKNNDLDKKIIIFEREIENKNKDISYLNEIILSKDEIISNKNEIIKLLKNNNGYGNIAAEQ